MAKDKDKLNVLRSQIESLTEHVTEPRSFEEFKSNPFPQDQEPIDPYDIHGNGDLGWLFATK